MNIRVVNEYPWSNRFAYNMLLRPTEKERNKTCIPILFSFPILLCFYAKYKSDLCNTFNCLPFSTVHVGNLL